MVRVHRRPCCSHSVLRRTYSSGGRDIHDNIPLPSSQSEEVQGSHVSTLASLKGEGGVACYSL